MSTRANIQIIDKYDSRGLMFYRHSDGYPEGTLPTLKKFLSWVKEGKIRQDVQQASGWLILIGASEYDEHFKDGKYVKKSTVLEPGNNNHSDWKCGAYEPTTELHGDIEYHYIVDLSKLRIDVRERDYAKKPDEHIDFDAPIKTKHVEFIEVEQSA